MRYYPTNLKTRHTTENHERRRTTPQNSLSFLQPEKSAIVALLCVSRGSVTEQLLVITGRAEFANQVSRKSAHGQVRSAHTRTRVNVTLQAPSAAIRARVPLL